MRTQPSQGLARRLFVLLPLVLLCSMALIGLGIEWQRYDRFMLISKLPLLVLSAWALIALAKSPGPRDGEER